ncbi:ABC transporter ATP-binding protein [Enterococcus sp. AD013-P3]|uniref:ABC transporter ATP-binding protein n=1 Tax=Enterococcus sp. AD013-P3 TaxID=3411036 RepID=UPI003B92A392
MARMRFDQQPEKMPKLTWPFVTRILSYFSPYPLRFFAVIALILTSSALGLVPPLLMQKIIDVALPQKDLSLLAIFIGLSMSATILLNLLGVAQGYLSTWIAKQITFNIKNEIYGKLTHMPQSFFAGLKEGEVLTRLTSDVDGIQQVFQSTVVNALTSVFVLATSLVALFGLNPILALISVATIPLFILPTRKVGKLRWQITSQSQKQLSTLNSHVQESLSTGGSLLMKLFTNEQKAYDEFVTVNSEVTHLQVKETLAGRWFRMAMSVFTTIGPMLVYLVGGFLLTKDQITIGGILTFATLLGRMYNPVTQLSNIQVDFMRSFALFDRIFEYLDLTPETTWPLDSEIKTPASAADSISEGQIRFEEVDFSYGQSAALQGIDLTLPAGQMTAIVGPSGAGKSTLTNLLPRLYTPTAGRITIDGNDIAQLPLDTLRRKIGMVSQEAFLFNSTIRENLLYAKPEATDDELVAAAKAAYIHEFIVTLPKGYDTPVGNRGVKLSGGEKQRLAIARVILKDPQILILDEATAALDALSEHYVQKAMDQLMKGRTAIVIAHRLSTIANADQILVMDQGTIVEQGSHEELLAQAGLYHKLYQTQFKLAQTEITASLTNELVDADTISQPNAADCAA